MPELIDLDYNVNAPVDGKYYKANWNLPKYHPGYVDVFEPYEGKFNPSVSRKRLGRWREDNATQEAFSLARRATTTTKERGVFWQMIYSLSPGKGSWVYFDAPAKSSLDRATILISRAVLGDSLAGAVAAQSASDKPLRQLPEPEPGTDGRGKGGQVVQAAPPSMVKTLAKVAVGGALVVLGFKVLG